ncbi:helix-turn-helix domain-containing protein [Deinococcus sp. HMF7620]|uniref:Helix-turn-helix domain-containing protein n=1 Tax=Deinococcus arboris TaxID=2682977 RepID=A0A7C9LN07_9DEIO|nr:helix-turn-helix transcriptional regulator [Deinococcus arboris]MVN88598.1 helix-turn-helix domain-containing protein [Deinococcus arboris]
MICLNADLIRQLRREQDLSLEKLAEQVGIDKRTLAAWESGAAEDAWALKLERLARFYGRSLLDFLHEIPEKGLSPMPLPAQASA